MQVALFANRFQSHLEIHLCRNASKNTLYQTHLPASNRANLHGFEVLNLNRIELKADERNLQSRKAMKSIGATEEGTLRQHLKLHDGYLRNTVFYSILKSEWEEVIKKFFYLRF